MMKRMAVIAVGIAIVAASYTVNIPQEERESRYPSTRRS